MNLANVQNNSMVDKKLKFETQIEKKENLNVEYRDTILKHEDTIRGKDLALSALSDTLFEKGQENRRLAEIISEFKNEHLMKQILNQKYAVKKLGSIKDEDLTVSNCICLT